MCTSNITTGLTPGMAERGRTTGAHISALTRAALSSAAPWRPRWDTVAIFKPMLQSPFVRCRMSRVTFLAEETGAYIATIQARGSETRAPPGGLRRKPPARDWSNALLAKASASSDSTIFDPSVAVSRTVVERILAAADDDSFLTNGWMHGVTRNGSKTCFSTYATLWICRSTEVPGCSRDNDTLKRRFSSASFSGPPAFGDGGCHSNWLPFVLQLASNG